MWSTFRWYKLLLKFQERECPLLVNRLRFMISRDITAILLQRLWQAASGLVTTLLIAHFLTPVQQGWYYTFLSLASLFTLFDLGLSVVLLQHSAHLFVTARWLPKGGAEGKNLDRYLALLGRSTRLYTILSPFFFLLVLPFGLQFFAAKSIVSPYFGGQWWVPWTALVLVTALNMLILPYFSVVEGSGRVKEVYTVRLIQGVIGSLACWLVLKAGGGLWAAVMVPTMGFAVAVLWLIATRPFMLHASLTKVSKELDWRQEIWPLQWRVGLSWMCSYLLTQIYTPILFSTQGPVVAGQMGLSLTVVNMLGLLAQSWITQSIPAMAQSVGRKDWGSLDRLFKRDFVVSIVAFIGGAFVLCVIHMLIGKTLYGERLLPFWPFAGLLGVTLIGHVNSGLAVHMRSFRREPFVWVSTIGAIVTVGGALWVAGMHGAEGVISLMFGVQFLFVFPLSLILWKRFNQAWKYNV